MSGRGKGFPELTNLEPEDPKLKGEAAGAAMTSASEARPGLMMPTLRGTVEMIQQIVPDASDDDVISSLKESGMDPNQAVVDLIRKGPFLHVRSRKRRQVAAVAQAAPMFGQSEASLLELQQVSHPAMPQEEDGPRSPWPEVPEPTGWGPWPPEVELWMADPFASSQKESPGVVEPDLRPGCPSVASDAWTGPASMLSEEEWEPTGWGPVETEALGESKGFFSSNCFSGLGDKLCGTGNAKDLASESNPLDAAKNVVDSTADRVSEAADKAQGEVKGTVMAESSRFPLGIAGLGDKVSGTAKEAQGQARDSLGKASGANPNGGGENTLGQAVDQGVGSAKEIVGKAKGLVSSNPLSGAADRIEGGAQKARGNTREVLGKAIGAKPIGEGKYAVASAADKVTGRAQKASGDLKGALGGPDIRSNAPSAGVVSSSGNLPPSNLVSARTITLREAALMLAFSSKMSKNERVPTEVREAATRACVILEKTISRPDKTQTSARDVKTIQVFVNKYLLHLHEATDNCDRDALYASLIFEPVATFLDRGDPKADLTAVPLEPPRGTMPEDLSGALRVATADTTLRRAVCIHRIQGSIIAGPEDNLESVTFVEYATASKLQRTKLLLEDGRSKAFNGVGCAHLLSYTPGFKVTSASVTLTTNPAEMDMDNVIPHCLVEIAIGNEFPFGVDFRKQDREGRLLFARGDCAFLKIKSSKNDWFNERSKVRLGTSTDFQVEESVVAVGYAAEYDEGRVVNLKCLRDTGTVLDAPPDAPNQKRKGESPKGKSGAVWVPLSKETAPIPPFGSLNSLEIDAWIGSNLVLGPTLPARYKLISLV